MAKKSDSDIKDGQSEEKYRIILENIEDGYVELDVKGNLVFFNDAYCVIQGYPKKELADMNYKELMDEENAQKMLKEYSDVYATGKPKKETSYEIITKNGNRKYLETSITPVKDSEGGIAGFRSIVRDKTAIKKTEEELKRSEEKFRTILESIQEGYFELDLDGNYTFVNDANCRLLGYSKEELVKMNARLHMDEKTHRKLTGSYTELYRTGIPLDSLEVKSFKKDGTAVIYETSVSLIRDLEGNPIGFRGVSRDITERKQREEKLSLLQAAMDVSPDMIFLVDRATMGFIYVNDTVLRLTGYTREEFMNQPPYQGMLQVDREALEKSYDEAIAAAPEGITLEMKVRTKDGTKTVIELHRRAVYINNRWIIVTISHDISQRWIDERKIRALTRMFAALSATNEMILHSKSPKDLYQRICNAAVDDGGFLTTGVLLFDPEAKWVRIAAASGAGDHRLRKARISIDESIPEGKGMVGTAFRTGKPCVSNDYFNDPVSLPWREKVKNVNAAAAIPLLRGGRPIGALIFYAPEKRAFDEEVINLLERMAENVVFALDNFEREAERKRAEERIEYLASHDSLTGLPNRLMFNQMLDHAIESARRYNRQLAVFFIDLDRFKTINDSLGHEAGDQLLQEIALRFKQTLRSSDIVARLGGDEFVILIEETANIEQAAVVARKILSAAIKPMVLLGEEWHTTASIGISMYPKDAADKQSLMKNADLAMYLAKEEGKNNYQFYSEDIKTKSVERLSVETNLRFALERNELFLHYQAKVDFKTNAITGAEALLRWQNPQLGLVAPAKFLPVAEETGLIIPVGRWVIKTACAQNVAWQREGLPPVCVSVNLSLRQLMDKFLAEDIKKALSESGMAPELLELEITEGIVMHNPTRMASVLGRIKELGVRLAIDGFGKAYSSLGKIKHFPVDTLKVDRSFIRNIARDSREKAIAEAVFAMGRSLSLTIVAEGIETVEQMNFLKDHSCDKMQGFYFSKPIEPDVFAELLQKHVFYEIPGK